MAMYSPSLEFLKSPFENVVNLLGGVPQGHEKAFKHGLYNAVALFFLIVCLAAGWALYIILEPFFKPLLWALLCGSVLHPFKHSLATTLQRWLDGLSDSSTPLLLGFVIIPVQLIDDASERVGNLLISYIKYLITFIATAVTFHVVYYYTPHLCICIIWQLGNYACVITSWFIGRFNIYMVVATVVGYLFTLILYWHPAVAGKFTVMSYLVWTSLSLYMASLVGSFQVAIFFTIQVLFLLGFLFQVWLIQQEVTAAGKGISFLDATWAVVLGWSSEEDTLDGTGSKREKLEDGVEKKTNEVELRTKDNISSFEFASKQPQSNMERKVFLNSQKPVDEEGVNESQLNVIDSEGSIKYVMQSKDVLESKHAGPQPRRAASMPIPSRQLSRTTIENQIIAALKRRCSSSPEDTLLDLETPSSTRYLYGLLWACGVLLLWMHFWVLHAVPILLFVFIVKRSGQYFGVWQLVWGQLSLVLDSVWSWCHARRDALFPIPVVGLFKLLLQLNSKVLDVFKRSVNMAASTVVILALIVITISTVAFLVVQVYSEGIHLIQLGGNAINNTLVKNSQLVELLPDSWQGQVDSMLDDAYAYGRQGISKVVRHWLKGVDEVKASHLEKQFLELWDRVYQSWMMSSDEAKIVGPTVTSSAVLASWDNIMDGVNKTPELFNMGGIISFVQENVGMLMTVLDSVWNIFKGNLTLAMDSFTALVAILFGGGTAVINFFVNVIVFFTALFYLLTSSGDMYKPVDLISSFSPNSGNRVAVALEGAIASVFKASFKRAVISGLWTWLIHNLFQVKMVYIPSVFAAVFGAIPFIGTYWASLPAVLELYFGQERDLHAVLLMLIQIVVTSMIDGAVYKEIKGGGHPYLTGLSIAGGMFCLGAEGAILGPLLLCGLFVGINMSTTLMNESPSSEELPEQMKRLSELSQLRRYQ